MRRQWGHALHARATAAPAVADVQPLQARQQAQRRRQLHARVAHQLQPAQGGEEGAAAPPRRARARHGEQQGLEQYGRRQGARHTAIRAILPPARHLPVHAQLLELPRLRQPRPQRAQQRLAQRAEAAAGHVWAHVVDGEAHVQVAHRGHAGAQPAQEASESLPATDVHLRQGEGCAGRGVGAGVRAGAARVAMKKACEGWTACPI